MSERTRAEALNDLMEKLNIAGKSAADLVQQLDDDGDEGLRMAFSGMHRRLRSLLDTTFAIYEDEIRRNLRAPADDYTKGGD